MTEIRPLAADDLPAVATACSTTLLPDWGGGVGFLRETVLEHPWADPEAPSLVRPLDDGRLIGFIGVQARRLRFGDRELSGVCCSHLVVDPDRRAGATGALLVGRLLGGPQALTWSDSASEVVARIWRTYKGELDHSRACDWMLVLRPGRWVGSWARAAARREELGREVIPVGVFPFHTFARRKQLGAPAEVTGEDAGPAEVVEQLPDTGRPNSVCESITTSTICAHLFGLVRTRFGELVCRLVRHRGRPIGWYAYVSRRDQASRVLHLGASTRHADAVLEELIDDARRRGSGAVAGRLEPHLDGALKRRSPRSGSRARR